MRTTLSVVVPCRDEAATLEQLVRRVLAAVSATDPHVEIVVVDDGSTDTTLLELRRLAAAEPALRYLSFSRGFGKEAAVIAGLREARGDVVVLMDGDLQHPPEVITELVATLRDTGADQVVGVRDRSGESAVRQALSRAFHSVAAHNTDVTLRPGHGDFRAVTRRVVDAVLAMHEVNRFNRGLFSWVGFDIREVAFTDATRSHGKSRWTTSGLLGYGVGGLLSFNERPLRIMVHLGWIAVLVFFAYVAYVLVTVVAFGIETPGYVTLIASIFFFGGLQLLSIGLLGEYLGRIYMEVKARPAYVLMESGPAEPADPGAGPSA